MTKTKAFLLGLLSTVTGTILWINDHSTPILAFVLGAALFFCIGLYKYRRDYLIVKGAEAKCQTSAQTVNTPPKESPGSRQLFVPPPVK